MATVAVMMTVGSAQAGWHEFWDRVHLDFHRNNSWPQPFSSVDRRATCAPFNAMVASGWRRQNTLGLHYFDRETQALNEAGKRRLHWIMSNSPEQHRTVYVAESHVQDQSERRIDSVQTALAQQLPGQSLPAVIPVQLEPRGWPAEYIDTITRKSTQTIPEPRLPSFQQAGGGGGS